MKNVGIIYAHLLYFVAIWYILCQFDIFCGNLVYSVAIWYILCPFGIFCVSLVYFVSIWYILCQFGIFCVNLVYFVSICYVWWQFVMFCGNLLYLVVFFPFLVRCANKNLAILHRTTLTRRWPRWHRTVLFAGSRKFLSTCCQGYQKVLINCDGAKTCK
jgi:hypothetical protein